MENFICKFCNKQTQDFYCNWCGKKIISQFNKEDFFEILNNLIDSYRGSSSLEEQKSQYFSNSFNFFLKQYPFGFLPSKTRLFHLMLVCGYLLRCAEEKFIEKEIIIDQDLQIDQIIKTQGLKQGDKIERIVNLIDSKITSISLHDLDNKYVIFPEIKDYFFEATKQWFENFFNQAVEEGQMISKNFDVSIIWESASHFAVFGYLFKTVETYYFLTPDSLALN
jgi:hypothetical protein